MQTDYTIFRIPHQAQAETPVADFDVQVAPRIEPTNNFSTSAQLLASNSDLIVRPPVSKPNVMAQKIQTLHFEPFSTGQLNYRPVEKAFPLYEELNKIAEELEKCRSKIS